LKNDTRKLMAIFSESEVNSNLFHFPNLEKAKIQVSYLFRYGIAGNFTVFKFYKQVSIVLED
jgi:hypothetical protein